MPLRTKNQPLAGMLGGRVVSCGLSGESKRALSFCCYRYGAEIIRQTLLCRLGACREILPGVPGPKAWHREELLSGLRESLLCRQIPPGVPKSFGYAEKSRQVYLRDVGPWYTRRLYAAPEGREWYGARHFSARTRGAGYRPQDFSACKSSQRYSIPCFSARVHSTWYTGRFFLACRSSQWYDARHFPAQQRDGNAVSYLHVAAAKQKRSLPRREVSALA